MRNEPPRRLDRGLAGSPSGAAGVASRLIPGQGNFAFAVTGIGDANGDGFDDVVLGSPFYSPGGLSFIGSARVHLGSASSVSATAATVLLSGVAGDRFGGSVSRAAPRRGREGAVTRRGVPSGSGQVAGREAGVAPARS